MNECRIRAYGKINLGLDVIGKRPDGYHDVRMVMQTVQLYDQVVLSVREQPGVTMECNLPFLPVDGHNLVYRAVERMRQEYRIHAGVHIRLRKCIPVSAGMAGGSSDCAAALYGMNRLFELGQPVEKLMELGVTLGADVPYCLMRGTALAEGIGEILTPLAPMPDCFLLIAKPPVSVSTRWVYENLDLEAGTIHPDIDGMVDALEQGSLEGVARRLGNVLEDVTIPEYPVIRRIKERMLELGAENALMSGSGPTVFGIFAEAETAQAACTAMRLEREARQIYLVRPFYADNRGIGDKKQN